MEPTQIAIFRNKEIRKTLHNGEWWFSVIDVVGALTDSTNARDYWYKMKIRVKDEEEIELSTICRQLKLRAPDGKMRETDCAGAQGYPELSGKIGQLLSVIPAKAGIQVSLA
ncbi:MAG: hypothetical protein AAB547_03290 [Patescibacteria group bacterium]